MGLTYILFYCDKKWEDPQHLKGASLTYLTSSMVVWFGYIGHISSAKEGRHLFYTCDYYLSPHLWTRGGRLQSYFLFCISLSLILLAELEDVSSLLCEALTNISTTCPAHIREGFMLIFEFRENQFEQTKTLENFRQEAKNSALNEFNFMQ